MLEVIITRPNVQLFPYVGIAVGPRAKTFFILPGQHLTETMKIRWGLLQNAVRDLQEGVPAFLDWDYVPNNFEKSPEGRSRRIRLVARGFATR